MLRHLYSWRHLIFCRPREPEWNAHIICTHSERKPSTGNSPSGYKEEMLTTSDDTCYCKILLGPEAAGLATWNIASLWTLTGASAAVLPRCMSERSAYSKLKSLGFETLRDHMIKILIVYSCQATYILRDVIYIRVNSYVMGRSMYRFTTLKNTQTWFPSCYTWRVGILIIKAQKLTAVEFRFSQS